MKPRVPLTPAQRAHVERDLLAEHDARTLARAGEPRISRNDEQAMTDRVRAAEAATKERQVAEYAAQRLDWSRSSPRSPAR